MNMTDNSLFF